MRSSPLVFGSIASALLQLAACGSGSSSTGNVDGGGGPSTKEPSPANGKFLIEGAPLLAATENGRLAALDGGDVFFTARTAGELVFARIGPSGEVRWAKSSRVSGNSDLPSHVEIVGTHAYVLAASQAATGLRVYDVDAATGAINGAKSYSEGTFPTRGRALPGGGLVVSSPDGVYMKIDASLGVTWSKRGRAGGDVTLLADGGFAFAGIAMSLTPVNPANPQGPQVGTGAALHMVDRDGASRGWFFMGSGPGTHSLGGVRRLPDGKLLVPIGVDSTRADAVVSLDPLALAIFEPDGKPSKMLRVKLRTKDVDARDVDLQFGGAQSTVARDDATWVGFVANSGALGSDVRGSVVARFGHDGALRDAVFGGVIAAPTTGNAALMFNLVNGTLALTRATPGDDTCVTKPEASVDEVKPFLDSKSPSESELDDVVVNVTETTTTPTDVTLTTTDGACAKQ